MKTFVINLDRNVERLKSTDAELRRVGLAYERFPAVCGKSLSAAERKAHYRPFRARCVCGAGLRDGEIGCALSHVGVCRRIAEEGVPYALVLEDDVKLSDRFASVLAAAEAFVDARRPQVVVLSSLAAADRDAPPGVFRVGGASCADAYLITRPAARTIAAANDPVVAVADAWSRWSRRYGVEIYQARPSVVRQDNERLGTDVDTWRTCEEMRSRAPRRRGIAHKVLWKAYRACGLSLDWLLWRITGK